MQRGTFRFPIKYADGEGNGTIEGIGSMNTGTMNIALEHPHIETRHSIGANATSEYIDCGLPSSPRFGQSIGS